MSTLPAAHREDASTARPIWWQDSIAGNHEVELILGRGPCSAALSLAKPSASHVALT